MHQLIGKFYAAFNNLVKAKRNDKELFNLQKTAYRSAYRNLRVATLAATPEG